MAEEQKINFFDVSLGEESPMVGEAPIIAMDQLGVTPDNKKSPSPQKMVDSKMGLNQNEGLLTSKKSPIERKISNFKSSNAKAFSNSEFSSDSDAFRIDQHQHETENNNKESILTQRQSIIQSKVAPQRKSTNKKNSKILVSEQVVGLQIDLEGDSSESVGFEPKQNNMDTNKLRQVLNLEDGSNNSDDINLSLSKLGMVGSLVMSSNISKKYDLENKQLIFLNKMDSLDVIQKKKAKKRLKKQQSKRLELNSITRSMKVHKTISPMLPKKAQNEDSSFDSQDDVEIYSSSSDGPPRQKSDEVAQRKSKVLEIASGIFDKNMIRRRSMNKNIIKKIRQRKKSEKKVLRLKTSIKKSFWGMVDIDDPNQLEETTAHRFGHFQKHFADLSSRIKVKTSHDINSIQISHNELYALVLMQPAINILEIMIINLIKVDETCEARLSFRIFGDEILRSQEIVQNQEGTLFCMAYFNSGVFQLRVFNNQNECINELIDINKQIEISTNQRFCPSFDFPSITATFINKHIIAVNVFDSFELNHWFFTYDFENQKISSKVKIPMNCSPENFIMKCLYDTENNFMYILYRHGECLTIDESKPEEFHLHRVQILTRMGIGNAFLINSKCMAFRHSGEILFFKREENVINHTSDGTHKHNYSWQLNHVLQIECQIYSAKGSQELIATTLKKIYCYSFDEHTQLPILKSVILNFMSCNSFIHSINKQAYISYTVGQGDLIIYRRRNHHSFRVPLDYENYKFSEAINLTKSNSYCISDSKGIHFFSQTDFKEITYVQVFEDYQVSYSDFRNQVRILSMKVSQNKQNILVVFLGKDNLLGTQQVTEILVYEIKYKSTMHLESQIRKVELLHRRKLPTQMQDISTQFEFLLNDDEPGTDSTQSKIFLIDEFQIYLYDFLNQTIHVILDFVQEFQFSLATQPCLFVWNQTQTNVFICAQSDVLLVDIQNKIQVDLDEIFVVGEVKACLNAFGKFFILANKLHKTQGVYLIQIDDQDISVLKKPNFDSSKMFIIKWNNQLDIGDANLFYLTCKRHDSLIGSTSLTKKSSFYSFDPNLSDQQNNSCMSEDQHQQEEKIHQSFTKELILSFKTIYKNTYDIIVIDMIGEQNNFVFRHESFHLWEQYIKGCLLSSMYFLTISQTGVYANSLTRSYNNLTFNDPVNPSTVRELHSLQMCEHLKINPSNHIVFKYSNQKNSILINIQEQYTQRKDNQTQFEDIYSILIEEMDLWEILLFQGIFCCSSQGEMSKLITQLPDARIFFKSYLELDLANLITILSFDGRSIKALLTPENIERLNTKYTVFYKIFQWGDLGKRDIVVLTAVDIALKNNQIQALNQIIEYIVKYQNSYIHFYLFEKNFKILLDKGINLKNLLDSDIFNHKFDFDNSEWPQTHSNHTKMIKPFNGSIFEIRQRYHQVFEELAAEQENERIKRKDFTNKFYKIKYTLNLLTIMEQGGGEDEASLMDLIGDTDQIEILQTKAVKDLITFKWENFGKKVHYLSAVVHITYVIFYLIYLNNRYLNRSNDYEFEPKNLFVMLFCNSFFMMYDMRQLLRQGLMYMFDPWNYNDQLYIWIGFVNLYLQFDIEENQNHYQPLEQSIMIIFTILMLFKSFFFLRIFQNFTKLVIMIQSVLSDIKEFLAFYFILLVMFSCILGILGVGNYQNTGNQKLKEYIEEASNSPDNIQTYPGYEYNDIQQFIQNILTILRFSLGDFDFGPTNHLNRFERTVFWIVWVFIVLMTCVVFLNFIIAEVSQSYSKVNIHVDEFVIQEKAKMINESEVMMWQSLKKNRKLFPKFIIVREIEE